MVFFIIDAQDKLYLGLEKFSQIALQHIQCVGGVINMRTSHFSKLYFFFSFFQIMSHVLGQLCIYFAGKINYNLISIKAKNKNVYRNIKQKIGLLTNFTKFA